MPGPIRELNLTSGEHTSPWLLPRPSRSTIVGALCRQHSSSELVRREIRDPRENNLPVLGQYFHRVTHHQSQAVQLELQLVIRHARGRQGVQKLLGEEVAQVCGLLMLVVLRCAA